MKHSEEMHKAADGAEIYRQQWFPDDEPRAVVCLVHGLGEHSSRYGHLAQRFTDQGFAVFSMDLRGHGKSSGNRGDLRITQAIEDVDELLDQATTQFPGLPVFIYGHSLGGLITMTYTVQRTGLKKEESKATQAQAQAQMMMAAAQMPPMAAAPFLAAMPKKE